MIYPWQSAAWQQISSHWQQQAHAWLLHGRQGTGKLVFAQYLAQAMLCEQPQANHQPCGQCASCHLFAQKNHPDYCELQPETADDTSARKLLQIKVDAVRTVLDFAHLSSHRGGRRVVLIYPAESMNLQAANALLKILEEPPPQVTFLLVSHNKDKLLPTIKSRCRALVLPAPAFEEALQFLRQNGRENAADLLAFHGGAPLFDEQPEQDVLRQELLDLLVSPRLLAILDYAGRFDKQKLPLSVLMDWLQKWLTDMSLSQQNMAALYYPSRQNELNNLTQRIRASLIFDLQDKLISLAPYGQHTLSVKMQAESLLIDYLTLWQHKTKE
ncbi:DNA polymerase III subunit delta' [Stenoxybacter acetivorans]|uniref:DNA polymerase III subunit delta' n=1 Tax=Stenoxybacter acetivorans TaxID=422441 RepID=UPI00055B3A7F|nr:DNA polymerase III subunit delta' [Stenoxybacter acetivorans]